MKYTYFFFIVCQFIPIAYLKAQNSSEHDSIRFDDKESNISITYDGSMAPKENYIKFEITPVNNLNASVRTWSTKEARYNNGIASCRFRATAPVFFTSKSIFIGSGPRIILLEPGDSVVILTDKHKKLSFQGKGSNKAKLQYEIDSISAAILRPDNQKDYVTVSIQDYLDWHSYLNENLEQIIPKIDSYKGKISSYAINIIKAFFIDQNIDDRSDKFVSLWNYSRNAGMTKENLCAIYDSTYFPVVTKYFPLAADYVFGTWKPIKFRVDRSFSFDYRRDSSVSNIRRALLYYNEGKSFYKGRIRELFMQRLLTKEFIKEFGFVPETERLLADYYKEPGFIAYKKWLREFEFQRREMLNEKSAFDFVLTDIHGRPFTKRQLKGKLAVFDFWFTGCPGCVEMTSALEDVKQMFKEDTNIVFVNVSVDKDRRKWLKSISEGKYTSKSGIHLYTGGEGIDNDMLIKYGIQGFPSILIMNPWGNMVHASPMPDPREKNGKKFAELLAQQQIHFNDGPYIFTDNQYITAYSFRCSTVLSERIENKARKLLLVSTDTRQKFKVSLKKSLDIEPSVFMKPEKLFVLSDIEGNFYALRRLLQSNNIIDKDYNWIFGNGHLVLNGDMFDRGDQVSECLWLIYSLEEKARMAGGYVHFILGNHEIMNLQGDTKYVKPKYFYNAELIGRNVKQLYANNSELGKWLRTKNVMERIGDILFAHGGISKEFTDSVMLPIDEINEVFRKNLDKVVESDHNTKFIFSYNYSPFWFRLYYEDKDEVLVHMKDTSIKLVVHHPSESELDDIMTKWKVKKIITGHTVVGDTISVHYGGKVINTDTKHADGKSEALLIERDDYFRVDQEGKRYLLFVNPQELKTSSLVTD